MASLSRVKHKEGYLVKKGHVRHNWKTRWFVLYDERLCYYKKKGDREPAGYVLLQGCFIVSPCTEYTKKESVFRLTSKEGVEYLIQAVNDEERDSWANTIAEAIRKLEARDRKSRVQKESKSLSTVEKEPTPYAGSTSGLGDIIDAMQDPSAGVPLDNHSCRPENKTYKLCFTGVQMVDWLLKWCFVPDREQGVALCNVLLEEAHLQPVGMTSKDSFRRKGRSAKSAFVDESDALYRFSALRFSSNQDVLDLDSSDESSDYDDETEMRKIPNDVIKGTIVKQGFLEKKGHVRHNWKTRKFVLCTDPPILYYCKPSKGNLPVGQLKLDKCEIKSLSKDEDLCLSDSFKKSQKYPILLRTRKGVKYVIRAASEMDRLDWIESLQSVSDDPHD